MCPLPFAVVAFDSETGQPARDVDGHLRKVATGNVGLLITKVTDKAPFDGYTDPRATEKKLVRNGFRRGDCWFNTGDLVRDQGWGHVAFVDRLGDTFRWKGENVATTEVEAALDEWPAIEQAVVYGVEVPGAEGRAGMAAVKLRAGAELDGPGLARHLAGRLPGYAIPLFLRVIDEIEQTSTFKSRKVALREDGFAGGDATCWPIGRPASCRPTRGTRTRSPPGRSASRRRLRPSCAARPGSRRPPCRSATARSAPRR